MVDTNGNEENACDFVSIKHYNNFVANINSREWLIFKIESHSLASPSPSFCYGANANNGESNICRFFGKVRNDEPLYIQRKLVPYTRTESAANYGQNLLLIYCV